MWPHTVKKAASRRLGLGKTVGLGDRVLVYIAKTFGAPNGAKLRRRAICPDLLVREQASIATAPIDNRDKMFIFKTTW
jgi:hypothetical protein